MMESLLVDKGAFAILAILDHHLVRNVLIDFAALEFLADSLSFLDAEAPLLVEELLHPLLLMHDFHEDTSDQSEEGDEYYEFH